MSTANLVSWQEISFEAQLRQRSLAILFFPGGGFLVNWTAAPWGSRVRSILFGEMMRPFHSRGIAALPNREWVSSPAASGRWRTTCSPRSSSARTKKSSSSSSAPQALSEFDREYRVNDVRARYPDRGWRFEMHFAKHGTCLEDGLERSGPVHLRGSVRFAVDRKSAVVPLRGASVAHRQSPLTPTRIPAEAISSGPPKHRV